MATESPQIEQLVQRGISAAREGRYGVAQQSLREAVRLAPNHEQAWLWLSGVEDTDQGKLTALQNVLRINPRNAAATRGLEHLSQPKVVDLASLLPPAPTPPPAKAGWSPPPAQAAPPVQAAPPAWSPPAPASPPSGPLATSPLTPGPDYAAAEPTSEEQQVNPDMLADLRPAIAKARKKRGFWPSTSEVIILVILVVLLSGIFFGTRIWLRGKFPDRSNVSQRFNPETVPSNTSPNSNLEPTLAPAVQPTSAQVVQTGGTFSSRSYSIQIASVSVAEDNRSTTVEVVLQNPTTRATGFRQRDFLLRTGVNARLALDAANSSLFAGKAESELTIPPNGLVSGTLVFTGDASRSPLTLIWQPFNGAVNQQITVK
jgi:hypothetical protein